ncbi:MAG: VWA containing CoxE family protein [Evtepia sp.]
MFIDFFHLLRAHKLNVTLNEWMTLMEGLDKGLARNSLLEFYYLGRAVLVKTEADFDKYDLVFSEYFHNIQTFDEIPSEFMEWLKEPKQMKDFDKDEVDSRTDFDLEKLRELLEERLQEQNGRHDGGQYWVGTGGTSTMGNRGYSKTGIRVGGVGGGRRALQVAGDREYRDFREDNTLDLRQFQLAFRRLRQFAARQDGPKDQLNLDKTIDSTCDNAGYLKLEFERPKINGVKVLLLFDSGGSMLPYTRLCSHLFQAVSKANNFKDLKIYYFHNCVYDELFQTPTCSYNSSVKTQWVLNNLDRDYKVIFVGDASMAPSELFYPGGGGYYNRYNVDSGLLWLQKFRSRFQKLVWFNPIPAEQWAYDYGAETIETIAELITMYHLTVDGLGKGLKKLTAAR